MKPMGFVEFCETILEIKLTVLQRRLYRALEKTGGRLNATFLLKPGTATLQKSMNEYNKYLKARSK